MRVEINLMIVKSVNSITSITNGSVSIKTTVAKRILSESPSWMIKTGIKTFLGVW